MRVAHSLLVGVVLASWLLPYLLDRVDLRRRDPVTLIVGWLLSMAGVILASLAGIVLLLYRDNDALTTLIRALLHCSAVVHHSPQKLEALGGLLGGLLLTGIAARAVVIATRARSSRTRARQEYLKLLRLAARVDPGPPPTLWLEHDRPLAFSLSGRPGVIVATEGLTRHLQADTADAILAHEHAHLRGRHHLIVAIADSMGAGLPFLPLFRRAPRAVRDLVELAADAAAVRHCGVAAVQSAIVSVTGHGSSRMTLPIPEQAHQNGALNIVGQIGRLQPGSRQAPDNPVEVRLARLRQPTGLCTEVRRILSRWFAGGVAVVAPFVSAGSLVITAAALTC